MPQPKTSKFSQKRGKILYRIFVIAGLAVFLASLSLLGAANNSNDSDDSISTSHKEQIQEAEYVPGEVIVKFKPEAKGQLKEKPTAQNMGVASIDGVNKKNKADKVEKVFKDKAKDVGPKKDEKKPKGVNTPDLSTIYKVSFPEETDIQEIISDYSDDPAIEYAEPNYKMEAFRTPNDPYVSSSGTWGQDYDDLWGLKKINAEPAWDVNVGSADVTVAVIDTGIDYNHKDLEDNVWINSDEIADNGIDDDGNGYVDDVYGYDFYNYDADPIDDHGHGTHCSGTIAAVGNNGRGVAGVSWNSKIMGVKFLSGSGSGWISDGATSIKYAADNGADVLSNSWGGWGYSQTLQDAIDYAYSKGTIVVAAAGNENTDAKYTQPAGLNNVVTVAATDSTDSRAGFSNYGNRIDVAAPGVDTLSLKAHGTSMGSTVGGQYSRASGTSMATPHVAGASALIWSENPSYSNQEVEQILETTADDLGDAGFDQYFGHGRINAYSALLGELLPVSVTNSTVIVDSSTVYLNQDSTITVTLKNSYNTPVSGKEVQLSSSRSSDTIVPLQTHTNTDGEFSATVTSSRAGTSTITARDVTDGMTINQTVSITFVERDAEDTPELGIPAPISDFGVFASNGQTALSWTNPDDSNFAGTKIIRRENRNPRGINDGIEVYNGDGTTYVDTRLSNGTTYHYAAFTYNEADDYSAGVYGSATPIIPASDDPLSGNDVNIVSGAGPGGGPQVRGFNTNGNHTGLSLFAYDRNFKGGVRLATGDVDGDGQDEIIVGAGTGGGPHIRVFEKDGTAKPIQFFAFHPDSRTGVDVAAGDVDGDGKDEIAACQLSNGQAWVKVYTYEDEQSVLGTWNAFGAPEVGCTVTMGDIDQDGEDEVIVGAGNGGGPQIRVFEADGTAKSLQFFAFHPLSRTGVDVAAGDVDGDGKDEIATSQLANGEAWVKVYEYDDSKAVLSEFRAYPQGVESGANVGLIDIDNDGEAEILTGAGNTGGPQVRAFEMDRPIDSANFFAYGSYFRGGVDVAGGHW